MRWILLVAALVVSACHREHPQEPENRAGPPGFKRDGKTDGQDFVIWHKHLSTPDIIIYDIQNGFVWTGDSQQGNLLLNLRDGAIFDASNTTMLCRYGGHYVGLVHLVDAATSEVIFTTDEKVVFEGSSRVLSFWFRKADIYAGAKRNAEIVATASVDMSRVSAERKLLVAALYSARCGAPVLDP